VRNLLFQRGGLSADFCVHIKLRDCFQRANKRGNMEEIYYTVYKWITEKLGLKRDDKDVYAILYGVTKGGESEYFGEAEYFAEFLEIPVRAVYKALANLCARGLIVKIPNTIRGCVVSTNYKIDTSKLSFLNDCHTTVGTTVNSGGAIRDNNIYNLKNNAHAHAEDFSKNAISQMSAEARKQFDEMLDHEARRKAFFAVIQQHDLVGFIDDKRKRAFQIMDEYTAEQIQTMSAEFIKDYSTGNVQTNALCRISEKEFAMTDEIG
jgi:predicted transcriptional regulator